MLKKNRTTALALFFNVPVGNYEVHERFLNASFS